MKEVDLSRTVYINIDLQEVEEISGENLSACYQCGKCTAGCPSVSEMDVSPHTVIRLLQLGQIDEVLEAEVVWLCAACQTCKVRCPKGVDLAKIMEALRQILLRKNITHTTPESISKEDIERLPQIAVIANFRKMTP
jgi:heterodisulfide reductase subunit C